MAYAKARTCALLAAACFGSLTLAACSHPAQDEMSWARAALERNERIEIVATDPQARTFTVRSKDTGALSVVRADQVTAAPAPASAPPAASAAATPAAAAAPTGESDESAAKGAPAAAATEEAAGRPQEPPAARPAAEPPVFASRALQPGSPARPVPGQVIEAGPGYLIEAAAAPASTPAAREPGPPAAAELRREPIVCQGQRMLHIDNLNLQFEGDAVSAEDGCEIHITNSRIRATGVGVSARAANVHIDNSLIEGDAASIEASDGAQIYTASSRFRGLSRRLDTAAVHDLGGNVWN
ncbi:MAG TPA: hypothetical protein VMT09_00600 [Steroidobacteraceae bacterium]|nr:hypothetical protein [Steroidobacteraceae bacterium]